MAVDTSYAPVHENFKSIQGIMMTLGGGKNPLMWSSTRQPFIAQSTAEAELLGYNECVQNVESLSSLLSVFGYNVTKRILGDSKAGISQLANEGGSWRTRHLRIRSAKLREMIQQPGTSWSIEHCEGGLLVSDGLTKALQHQKFGNYVKLLGMVDQVDPQEVKDKIEPLEGQPKVQSMHVIDKKDVMKVALGAGVALVLTDHKMIGAALLALAGFCAFGDEKTKQETRPEKKEERPQQDPDEDKTPQGKRDGAAHLPTVESVTGKAHSVFGSPKDNTSRVGSSIPGLRALRAERKSVGSDGKSDGAGADGSSTAAAAGAASSTSGLGEQSVRVTVQRDHEKLYVDADVKDTTSPFPPHGIFNDPRSLFGTVEGRSRAEKTTGPMTGAAWWRTRTGKESDREGEECAVSATPGEQSVHATTKASVGSSDAVHNAETVACDSLAADRRGTGHEGYGSTRSVGGPERPGSGSGSRFGIDPTLNPMSKEGIHRCYEEPWNLQLFAGPPGLRSDKWDMSLSAYGWYVKIHGKSRRRTFHPIHRSTPVETSMLRPEHTTVTFDSDGTRRVLQDQWTNSRNVEPASQPVQWRGYTFFKKINEEEATESVGRVDRVEPGSPSSVSDGSFEKVSEP